MKLLRNRGLRLKQLLISRMVSPFSTKSSKHAGNKLCLFSKIQVIHCCTYNLFVSFCLLCFCLLLFIFSSPLRGYFELEDYLWSMYASAAQYNHPPKYPVTRICDAIDGTYSVNGTLSKIAAGVFAFRGSVSCYINEPRNETETDVGWRWQVLFTYIFSDSKLITGKFNSHF